MTAPVYQCEACQRHHDGHNVIPFRFAVPEFRACGRPDCADIAKLRPPHSAAATCSRIRKPRLQVERSPVTARLPYKDTEDDDCAPIPAPTQEEFEARGAAKAQNEILEAFFRQPENQGVLWPMRYLQKISHADRMNNRAIDLREIFKPLGFGLWNELRPYGPTGAWHSHYGLFPLAEIEQREREREERRANRNGQQTFA